MTAKYLGARGAAKKARDKALAQVLANEKREWKEAAYVFVAKLPYGRKMTGEQIRLIAYKELGKPHHHNVWGSIINECIKRGFLEPFPEEQVHMKTKKSHGRKTQLLLTGAWKK